MTDRIGVDKAVLVALVAAAFVIYWRSLSIGLLADDFALVGWANEGRFAPVEWPYFRPTPLALWWGLFELLGDDAADLIVHTVNTALHGLNAFLVYRVALIVGSPFRAALGSAVLFVVYPTAVEPVVWPSAVSDVLLATLTLTLVIDCARPAYSARRATLHVLLMLLALGSKETAVSLGPLLLSMTPLLERSRRWPFVVSGWLAMLLSAIYVAVRVGLGNASHPAVINATSILSVVVGPFRALVFPWHESVFMQTWWGLGASAAVVAGGLAARLLWQRDDRTLTLPVVAAVWVVVSVAPTIGLFAVGPDLQGARYLYLASTLWSIAIAGTWLTLPLRALWRNASFVALVCGFAIASVLHQDHWAKAAALRDVVMSSLASMPPECTRVFVTGVPDNYRGAYVARNGLREGLLRQHGRTMDFVQTTADALPRCRIDFRDLQRAPSK